MNKDRLLSLLGICKKAGKLAHGFDAASKAVQDGDAGLILTSSELSPKSRKEIEYISAKKNIRVVSVPVTMSEIEQRTGRRAGILAVADKGLAEAILSRVNEED